MRLRVTAKQVRESFNDECQIVPESTTDLEKEELHQGDVCGDEGQKLLRLRGNRLRMKRFDDHR